MNKAETMTSHEFARQLLEGPDLPIITPKVKEYDDSGELMDPLFAQVDGVDDDGNPAPVLILDYAPSFNPPDAP